MEGVLFIHGYMGDCSSAGEIINAINLAQENVKSKHLATFMVQLPKGVDESIVKDADIVEAAIVKHESESGIKIRHLICQSRGGLVGREWLLTYGTLHWNNPRERYTITTVAAPLGGTQALGAHPLFKINMLPQNITDMSFESQFIKNQWSKLITLPPHLQALRRLHFCCENDVIVFPSSTQSQWFSPSDTTIDETRFKIVTVSNTQHGECIYAPEVCEGVVAFLLSSK